MIRYTALAATLMLLLPLAARAQQADGDATPADLLAQWNAAYRALDAKTLASLFAPEVEIVDRFGHWVKSESVVQTERLWQLTFTEIYRGRPGPERVLQGVRMLTSDVAVLTATTQWAAVTLDDGTVIPPHGEIDTFTLVRRDGAWRIAALNIHNQMAPGRERPGERVPGR